MAAILLILLALAVVTTPAQSKDRCALRRLLACGNTNELVWDKTFQQAVRRFFGPLRATYIDRNGLVATQMFTVLGGPPDPPVRIGNRFRFTSCEAHNCGEKGAVILEPDGQLLAFAILHSNCAESHGPSDCFAHMTLTVFIRDPVAQNVIDNLSDWARLKIADWYTLPGTPEEHLDAVQIKVVK
jgi:hypothetical protein